MPTTERKMTISGIKYIYNNGILSKTDGPSVEYIDGTLAWFFNDVLHRDNNLPAIEYSSGSKHWYQNGKLHREEGAAIEIVNGVTGEVIDKHFYIEGKRLSEEEFVKVRADKVKAKLQRIVTTEGGTVCHYLGNLLHRLDGPAIEYSNGYKTYYRNGELHNENGPAIDCGDKKQAYFISGKLITKEEFDKRDKIMGIHETLSNNTFMAVDAKGTIRYKHNGELHKQDGPAIIFKNGDEFYYRHGVRHRDVGPAVVCVNGIKEYWIMGRLHREDGPAIITPYKTQFFLDGIELTALEHRNKIEEKTAQKMKEEKNNMKEVDIQTKETVKLTPPNIQDFTVKNEPLMSSKNDSKDRTYYNMNDEKHRVDGPAVVKNGDKFWYINDRLHRDDGPAAEYANGSKFWYRNGKKHRVDGPAVMWFDGSIEFWVDGLCHREGSKPAMILGDTLHYLLYGKLHREDGPASIISNGNKFWYQNNKLHRIDGPAVELDGGKSYWYFDGKQLDDPSIQNIIKTVECKNDPVGFWKRLEKESIYVTRKIKETLLTIKEEMWS